MCTAISLSTKDFYFGRNLDYEYSYVEEVTVTPRNFAFRFRMAGEIKRHYAMIGMAYTPHKFPLYYDAVNEKGLCIAGLNFVGNAVYGTEKQNEIKIAQFELIPYLLSVCASVREVKEALKKIDLVPLAYSTDLPVAQLHWLIADRRETVTLEYGKEGMKLYDNPVGVLANNPPFPDQMSRLADYMGLSPRQPENTFSSHLQLTPISRGMGGLGLPGDLSSQSRFVRAAFVKLNSVSGTDEEESVNRFFHVLGAVEQQRGCCEVKKNEYEITIYSSCCNAQKGIYYYTTYENRSIRAVDMYTEDLEGSELNRYPLQRGNAITFQNR